MHVQLFSNESQHTNRIVQCTSSVLFRMDYLASKEQKNNHLYTVGEQPTDYQVLKINVKSMNMHEI